ncbi:hypothetical protein PYCC9005_001230 [Savitreella phatthalungensis]
MVGLKTSFTFTWLLGGQVVLARQDTRLLELLSNGEPALAGVRSTGRTGRLASTVQQAIAAPSSQDALDAPAYAQLLAVTTAGTFDQPIDHTSSGNVSTFKQRFWVNDDWYAGKGPIVLLLGGEADATKRLSTLQTGIGNIIAEETDSKAILIEHRYYGQSLPFPDYKTENLKYLTVNQTLHDFVNFRKTAGKQLGVESSAPWIVWGAGYGGVLAAILRKQYPDLFVGAVVSSGSLHRSSDFWEYWTTIMERMPASCRDAVVRSVEYIDNQFDKGAVQQIKSDFFMDTLDDTDFLNSLTIPLSFWQAQRWDRDDGGWLKEFCAALTKDVSSLANAASHQIGSYSEADVKHMVANWADYSFNILTLKFCSSDVPSCFASYSGYRGSAAARDDFSTQATFRPYLYQQCTELGMRLPNDPDASHARLISKAITHDYVYGQCIAVFHDLPAAIPAGGPTVDVINAAAGFHLNVTNMALVDGALDAFIHAGAHSQYAKIDSQHHTRARSKESPTSTPSAAVSTSAVPTPSALSTSPVKSGSAMSASSPPSTSAALQTAGSKGAQQVRDWPSMAIPPANDFARTDSPSAPFILLSNGVAHWDEFGTEAGSAFVAPAEVKDAQSRIVQACKLWLQGVGDGSSGKASASVTSPAPTRGSESASATVSVSATIPVVMATPTPSLQPTPTAHTLSPSVGTPKASASRT